MVKPIPEGYPRVCPNLVVEGAAELISFLERAFGAYVRVRNRNSDGTVAHAELQIGDSVVMVSDAEAPDEITRASLHLYVEDVDGAYAAALAAGGKAEGPPDNRFWGDRTVNIFDPAGNRWWVSTHVEDLTQDEIAARAARAD